MAEPHRSSTPPDDTALAELVLPLVEDLWGEDWQTEDEDDAGPPTTEAVPEPCHPPGFPDHAIAADEAVTFVRPPGGVVHAVALVFDDRGTAGQAWDMLVDERFARCFAQTLADEVQLDGTLELLGPVMRPSAFTLDRAGRRTVAHRAAFSGIETDGLLPVTLDLAVVVAGRAVVTVWAADPTHADAAAGWERLIDRVELRCDVALVND